MVIHQDGRHTASHWIDGHHTTQSLKKLPTIQGHFLKNPITRFLKKLANYPGTFSEKPYYMVFQKIGQNYPGTFYEIPGVSQKTVQDCSGNICWTILLNSFAKNETGLPHRTVSQKTGQNDPWTFSEIPINQYSRNLDSTVQEIFSVVSIVRSPRNIFWNTYCSVFQKSR